jgi:hypothetical protein
MILWKAFDTNMNLIGLPYVYSEFPHMVFAACYEEQFTYSEVD